MGGLTPSRPGELERQVGQGLATLANGMIEMRKAFDAQLDSVADELRREAEAREAEVRSHLGYVLAGSGRERVAGAILLAAGIACGVAAEVVGAAT